MSRNLWIGTSGFAYDHWKHVFYPEQLPSSKWFEFFSEHFPTVELNVTFYRMPKKEAFESWAKRSPKQFFFFVKGSRFITHIKRLKEPDAALEKFYGAISPLRKKRAGVLWQLPPQFRKDAARLEHFLRLRKKFETNRTVFEFRDESWFDEEIFDLFRKYGAVICRADHRDFYEREHIPDTGPFIYLRRHGPQERGLFSYSNPAIRKDAAAIQKWAEAGKDIFVYYNNDAKGAAVKDARRLAEMLHAPPRKKS